MYVFFKVVLHFPENFIRHVNDIVFFQPLTYNQLSSIIQLQVISIEERFKEKNIKISLTNKAIQSILQKSYKLCIQFSIRIIQLKIDSTFFFFSFGCWSS
jgi:ATP-dependent Clp protease ATP-binding subunit ClpA